MADQRAFAACGYAWLASSVEAGVSASAICKDIVLGHLSRRRLGPPRRPGSGRGEPPEAAALGRANLASARFLSVREARSRWAAALTIEDRSGKRYFAVYHLTERDDAGWQATGSFVSPDRVLPGRPDPFLSLGAFCAEGVFLANRESIDPATVSFFTADGNWIASHRS